MSHERVRERLAEFALDLLSPDEATEVEEHYGECPLCRIEARMYFQAREALAVGAGALAGDSPTPAEVDALVAEAAALLTAPAAGADEPASTNGDALPGAPASSRRRRFLPFGRRAAAGDGEAAATNGVAPGAAAAVMPPPSNGPSVESAAGRSDGEWSTETGLGVPHGSSPTAGAAAPSPITLGPGLAAEPPDGDPPAHRSLFARIFRRSPHDDTDEDEPYDDEEYEDDEDEGDGRVAEWWRGAALMVLPTALLLAGGLVYVMYQWNETKRDLHAAEVRAEGHPWRFDLITQTNDPAQPAAIVYVAANFRDGMLHASRFPALEQGQHFTVWAEGPTKTQWIAVLRPDPNEREIISDVGPMPEDTQRIFVTVERDADGSPTTPVLPAIVSGERR